MMLNFIRLIAVVSFISIIMFANNSVSQTSSDVPASCGCQNNIKALMYTNGDCVTIVRFENNWCIFSFYYRPESVDKVLKDYGASLQINEIYKLLAEIYARESGTNTQKLQNRLTDGFMAIFIYSLPLSLPSDMLKEDPKKLKDRIENMPKKLVDSFKSYKKDIVEIFLGIQKINNTYQRLGLFKVSKGCLVAETKEIRISIAADKSIKDGICKF